MKIKYGELNKKQQRMLVEYFIRNYTKDTHYVIADEELAEIHHVRPSEYFMQTVNGILDEWQSELAHDGKLHTARIVDGVGEMDHRIYPKEIECDDGKHDVCDLKLTERCPHGVCINCGKTRYKSEASAKKQTELCLIGI